MLRKKVLIVGFGLILSVACLTGCTRSIRNGLAVGVTDGLDLGLETLISDVIIAFGNQITGQTGDQE